MTDCIELAQNTLVELGIPLPESFNTDGRRHRFNDDGKHRKDGKHWYRITEQDGRVNVGSFTGLTDEKGITKFIANPVKLSHKELAERKQQQAQEKQQRDQKKQQLEGEAKEKVIELWAKAGDVKATHPYLVKKGIKPIGIKQLCDMLLIPLYLNFELINLQFITKDGEKRFKTNARKKSGYCILGNASNATQFIICEGYATGASLYQATKIPVIVAFDAGNLQPVVDNIRSISPNTTLFMACDNDQYKDKNVGVIKAQAIADKHPISLIIPKFNNTKSKPTDFNDLHQLEGIQEVKKQIISGMQVLAKSTQPEQPNTTATTEKQASNAIEQTIDTKRATVLKKLLKVIDPVDFNLVCRELGWVSSQNKDGAERPPLQKHYKVAIIDQLLNTAKINNWHLIRDEGASYIYTGCMWLPLTQDELKNFLKHVAIKQSYPEIEARDIKFINLLYDQALQDGFFKERNLKKSSMINLNNCTLVLTNKGVVTKKFDYRDFLTHQLPFNYNPKAQNPLFKRFLDDVLPDKGTQRTLQEVCGYLFIKGLKLEKIFFLYGTGANGKSVLFEIINGLVGDENISHYSLESLTDTSGYFRAKIKDKIVNYGTDIKLNKIDPGMFKTMASGEPIEVRNPYEQPFIMKDYAKLIFNINRLDNANIEHTHGFYRRILIIPFSQTISEEKQDKSLHQKILNGKAGVLNWIIEGAENVIKNEDIYISQECADFKNRFIKEADNVALFIEDGSFEKDESAAQYLKSLYDEYRIFCDEDGYHPLGKSNFKKRLVAIGYTEQKRNNQIYFKMRRNLSTVKTQTDQRR